MMPWKNSIRILGAGGHGKVALATALAMGIECEGIYDDDSKTWGRSLLGVLVRGPLAEAGTDLPLVAAIGRNASRKALVERFKDAHWGTLVHPFAFVHPSVNLGEGSVVFAGSTLQPDSSIGSHSIINTGATVDHDCKIGDFVHLAPGTHLAGNVVVENGVFIGIGTCALPSVRVSEWAQVGAGSIIIENIPPRCVAFGAPARIRNSTS